MGDGLEEKIALEERISAGIDDMFSLVFDNYASMLATSLGTSAGKRILSDCYEAPLLAKTSEEAYANASSLCHVVALTVNFPGVDTFREYNRGILSGCVGYDAAGKPVVCLLRDVGELEVDKELSGFISIVAAYELRTTVPEAAHKLSDS